MADPIAAIVARVLRIEPPPSWMVFMVVLISYFFIVSGVVYDIIVEPPAMGQTQDPRTGQIRAQPVLPHRINGQFIMEGLTAGFMYTAAGVAMIVLMTANSKTLPNTYKLIAIIASLFVCIACYSGIVGFITIKLPGYLR